MELRLLFPILTYLFLTSCQLDPPKEYDFDALLDAYGNVWNTGDMESLDTLVTDDFEVRINSSGPAIGKAHLIQSIEASRKAYADFKIVLKDKFMVGDNVCLITWEITGYSTSDNEPFSVIGFSVIFHGDGRITGEWISYSDIEWAEGLGYQLIYPEG